MTATTKKSETLDLDLRIPRPPESVRAWWTDLPEDYRAEDPTEQPYRIVTLARAGSDREFRTFWRAPDGSEWNMIEILRVGNGNRWTFHVPDGLGYDILDEFEAKPDGEGTRLHIHSTVTPRAGEPALPMAALLESMRANWENCARLCARDAP